MAEPQFAVWEAASGHCSGSARPGARALMSLLIAMPQVLPGLSNHGIYNCRDTALGNPSAHGEGRALDVGCNIANGNRLVKELLDLGPVKLGISVLIHNRVIYSRKSPNGRKYTGDPHVDHVHIEMTRHAAESLTPATAKGILAALV